MSDQRANPSTGGFRQVGAKLRYDLIPPEFDLQLALVLHFGAGKYAPHNYEKGMTFDDLIRGTMSHLASIRAGELIDAESGLPHASHAAWNMLTLGMQLMRRPELERAYADVVEARRSGRLEALVQSMRDAVTPEDKAQTPSPSWAQLNAAFAALREDMNWGEVKGAGE